MTRRQGRKSLAFSFVVGSPKAAGGVGIIFQREGKSMSDIVTGLRQVIQDLVAPDLKAHTVKLEGIQRQSEIQHDAVMKTLDAFRAEMRSGFAAA